jgi:dienelactone hydrolase
MMAPMTKCPFLVAAAMLMLSLDAQCAAAPTSLKLFDVERQRAIPLDLYLPAQASRCGRPRLCPVLFFSAGYGIGIGQYAFVADAVNALGYLMVSVGQELPGDAPIASRGDLFKLRSPNWARGAQNIRYAQAALRRQYPQYDWAHPVLAGHSNGGDIAAWLARESPHFASAVITLDNRRAPLPKDGAPKLLSIRASDFAADPGVLPNAGERRRSGACIMTIAGAHHSDINDGGGAELKQAIAHAVQSFLRPPPGLTTPGYGCDGDTALAAAR